MTAVALARIGPFTLVTGSYCVQPEGSGTKVLVVEDDAMVRGWIRLSLKGSEFMVVGEAAAAGEVAELVRRRAPELLLVDYRLGDAVGTELVRSLRLAGVAAPVVLMTANYEPGFNEAARESGAQGSVLKTGSSEELIAALRRVRDGEPAFDSRHPRRDPTHAALSPRERDVLRLLAAGKTNRQVASELGVSPETVKTLVARAFAKLGVTRRAQAVAAAQRMGLL
jgi:DNA-binding NarL/FixJ family response regulator